MKISIITVHNTVNYGSVLQTLATQYFFQSHGFSVEFIDYWRQDQVLSERINKLKSKSTATILKEIKKFIFNYLSVKSFKKQNEVFRSFINKHICITTDKYYSYNDILSNLPEADVYCTGSDQMWNSGWNQGIEKSFFLEYCPINKKRISFSTSIGKTGFNEGEVDETIQFLNKYNLITVREQSAVDLLAKYGIKSTLVLDPTLLYGINFWNKYISERKYARRYLLVYQLHLEHDNADFTSIVNAIAQKLNLDVVSIEYSYASRRKWKKVYIPSIEEFLSLFLYADYVVTDSFHGTAFSINLNKQFTSVYPKQFNTRIDNILDICKLKERRADNNYIVENCLEKIDFSYANNQLDERRKCVNTCFANYFRSIGE